MEDLRQEMILAAGPRQRRRELGISERAAQRTDTAEQPEHHDGETRRQPADLKSQAGEDAGPNHVRDDEARRRDPRDGPRAGLRRFRYHPAEEYGALVGKSTAAAGGPLAQIGRSGGIEKKRVVRATQVWSYFSAFCK